MLTRKMTRLRERTMKPPKYFYFRVFCVNHGTTLEIEDASDTDVAEVVRCRDCKWYRESAVLYPQRFCFRLKDRNGKRVGYNFADNDFCSHGELR